MLHSIRGRFVRTIAVVAAVAAFAGARPDVAEAINPPQRTTAGVVKLLSANSTLGGIQDFWARTYGTRYVKPRLYYFGVGVWMGKVCGVNSRDYLNNAFYCRGSHSIYIDKNWLQTLINKRGDFAAGGILAHEWGHGIAWQTQVSRITDFREEYHADCLAGMYTRYGYGKGRLTGSDYYEFRNWYLSQSYSKSHGYPQTRAKWFDYGYSQYSIASCNLAFNMTAPRMSSEQEAPPRTHRHGVVSDLV
jgi:predicted metalloprotease